MLSLFPSLQSYRQPISKRRELIIQRAVEIPVVAMKPLAAEPFPAVVEPLAAAAEIPAATVELMAAVKTLAAVAEPFPAVVEPLGAVEVPAATVEPLVAAVELLAAAVEHHHLEVRHMVRQTPTYTTVRETETVRKISATRTIRPTEWLKVIPTGAVETPAEAQLQVRHMVRQVPPRTTVREKETVQKPPTTVPPTEWLIIPTEA
jgi:hypothetical protein